MTLGRGEELEIEFSHQRIWCLCDEDSIKTHEQWGVSRLVNIWKYWESGAPVEGMEAPRPFPHTLP